MATPIIVNPTKPSQVVVSGTQKSGTPIKVETDLDYNRVQSMINESLGDVKIDTTEFAKEQTLTDGVNTLAEKIDNIKLPEIDTTNIASKDLERFFGVKPIEGYEFMTPEEVCSTLEEIMTTMDIDLTPEKAKEITNNTLNKG